MMSPLLRLVATQPHLLVDHVEAYADLFAEEVSQVSSAWKWSTVLHLLALCSLGVAAVLAGVALMFWAVVPVSDMPMPWVLVVTPLLPVVITIGCLLAARQHTAANGFDNLRKQLKADIGMLREVGTP
ncbi:hypothetical protein [Rhodoferax sp.]|uniref:hypothetical protein n=1 Tax=Rhodoferax sp. TaxID=50421 RepID=UPI00374DCAB2